MSMWCVFCQSARILKVQNRASLTETGENFASPASVPGEYEVTKDLFSGLLVIFCF